MLPEHEIAGESGQMYSVMKNQNGCYIKMSSHAMSSFHVLHLSKNTKVAIPFLISFRHCYANSDSLILFVFVYFLCLKALNDFFSQLLG